MWRVMEKTCTFTGNRPNKLPWGYDESDARCVEVKARIFDEVKRAVDEGYTRFICGMALGADFYFAEAVLQLKREHNLILECALPYHAQAEKWSEQFQKRHADILDRAQVITVLSDGYTPYCMHVRNRYMVDKSTRLISLCYTDSGGAFATIKYAQKKGLDVIFIN